MEQDRQIFRIKDHDGVDRLNDMDQFLRQYENDPVTIDVGGKDFIPTPVVQSILAASQHWSQRDLAFSICGVSEEIAKNLAQIGADLTQFIEEDASA